MFYISIRTLFYLALLIFTGNSLAAQARDEAIARAGFDLHYRVMGSGRPILLLSGGPGFDVDYLEPIARKLSGSGSAQVIMLEQRGTGRSRPAEITLKTLSLELLLQDIEALRTTLGAQRLTLLGHSWGGILALAYAAKYPEHVDALVLIDSGGIDMSFVGVFNDNIEARRCPEQQRLYERAMHELQQGKEPEKNMMDLIRANVGTYFFSRELANNFLAELHMGSFHSDVAQALFPDLIANYHVRDKLESFTRPVLIVQGRQDPMPESTAYETHLALKNSQLVFLDRSGHFPWIEQPEALFRELLRFLRDPGIGHK